MSHVTQGASWPWGSRPCHSEMPQGRPAPTGRLKPQLPTSPGPPPWSLAQDCLRRQRAERTAWAQDACRGNGSKGGTLLGSFAGDPTRQQETRMTKVPRVDSAADNPGIRFTLNRPPNARQQG